MTRRQPGAIHRNEHRIRARTRPNSDARVGALRHPLLRGSGRYGIAAGSRMCHVYDSVWTCYRSSMAVRETITISVPPELRTFLQGCVATGRYTSISEVVRAALREFERADDG